MHHWPQAGLLAVTVLAAVEEPPETAAGLLVVLAAELVAFLRLLGLLALMA